MAGPSALTCTGQSSFYSVFFVNSYNKPYLAPAEQVALLISRGMEITDPSKAESCLARIGYYRLSAYFYPFRKSIRTNNGIEILDEFRDETSFTTAFDLYVFDKKLRLLVLDALERIEVAIRTDISLQLGKHSPWALQNPDLLDGNFSKKAANSGTSKTKHDEWILRLKNKFERSKEDFAKHFKSKYSEPIPPIWIAVELWDFGTLSHFYAGMKIPDRDNIAVNYGIPDGRILQSWLRCLNDIRNICAHHSRLWNRPLVAAPILPKGGQIDGLQHIIQDNNARTRLYCALLLMRIFLIKINPSSTWHERLKNHVATLPTNQTLSEGKAGFPNGWREQPVWN